MFPVRYGNCMAWSFALSQVGPTSHFIMLLVTGSWSVEFVQYYRTDVIGGQCDGIQLLPDVTKRRTQNRYSVGQMVHGQKGWQDAKMQSFDSCLCPLVATSTNRFSSGVRDCHCRLTRRAQSLSSNTAPWLFQIRRGAKSVVVGGLCLFVLWFFC